MQMYDIIYNKRQGEKLSAEEIRYFVNGYTKGEIPDYQISALLMAIYFQGLDEDEIIELTASMRDSGDRLDLSTFGNLAVDKHSTGGVGDKTTLIVAPLAASLGLKVAKMSGRGLGHTGGTVDKLESIAGFQTELTQDAFLKQVEEIGIAVIGQSGNLTPADKKIYALRDVTATVDNIGLIASSIMSKKLAAGAKSLVLDVKVGSGALMKTLDDSRRLAQTMVKIGQGCGVKTAAVLSNMDIPLGNAVGNALEVMEALAVLRNEKHGDLRRLCVELVGIMAMQALGIPLEEGRKMAEESLSDGKAEAKFVQWITYQGGRADWLEDGLALSKKHLVCAKESGYLSHMETATIGRVATMLGAGRSVIDEEIDYGAGIVLLKKTGDPVKKGEPLAEFYTNRDILEQAERIFDQALTICDVQPMEKKPLIYEIIS